jgi:hypothetical protein
MANEQTPTGTVMRGRTVIVPHPTEKRVVGQHPMTGEPIIAPVLMEFGPEQEVTLPASEVARLQGLGFLFDPNKVIV